MAIVLKTEPGPRSTFGKSTVVLDTLNKFSDTMLKRVLNRNVTVDSYPDYDQILACSGTQTTIWFHTTDPIVLDGHGIIAGPIKIRADGHITIQGLKRLRTVESYPLAEQVVDITINNCRNVTEIYAHDIGRLVVDDKHTKGIQLFAVTVREVSVPKSLTYITCMPIGSNVTTLPKRLLEGLYSLRLTLNSQEELDKCEPDAFNVNVLIIESTIPKLDLTRFVFSNVTTLELTSEPDILFSNMDSLISWTSKPLTEVALLDFPRLMYLFILGHKFESTREKIYEHADLYTRGLYRETLKMDVRASHHSKPDPDKIIDVDDLLKHAESMAKQASKSSAKV